MKDEQFDNVKNNDVIVLFCAPHSKYPDVPKDYSNSILVDCPHCKLKMWLSEKKESIKKLAEAMEKEIIFACFDCFMELAKKHPEWKDHIRVDI